MLVLLQVLASVLQATTVALIYLVRTELSKVILKQDYVFIGLCLTYLVTINLGVMVLCFRRKKYVFLSLVAELTVLVLFAYQVF